MNTMSSGESLLITGGLIIDPSQDMEMTGDLLVQDGKIVRIEKAGVLKAPRGCQVIPAEGLIVTPGFIDLHCHLREPGFEDKETIATGTRAAAGGGYTTVCCMPNTSPAIETQSVVRYIKDKAGREGAVRVLPIGCISKGRKGKELAEMGELVEAGVVAFSDDGNPVSDSGIMRAAMQYSNIFGLPVIDHCEEVTLSRDGVMNEGNVATTLGLRGIHAAAEEIMVARDIILAELTGARLHIAHVSTAGSVELIQKAKAKGIAVTAEVTPHHLTLTEETVYGYNTNAKVNPPLRTLADQEALIRGLKENIIDAIATDHAPHTLVDKLCEFDLAEFGISGFETALSSLMKLVHSRQLKINTIISKLTTGPAGNLKKIHPGLGTLQSGSTADVTIFNPDLEWEVRAETLLSKGKNTPLLGQKMRGKVMMTIYSGKIVYNYNE